MKVKLLIKSEEINCKPIKFETSAIKKINRNSVSYTYIDEFGKTFLEVFPNYVIIEKCGKVNSHFTLKNNSNTSFNYETQYFSSKFEIFTKNLIINTNGFNCFYSIYQEKTLINSISISIHEF